ncbi:hypothetical protein [Lysinibacillus boronitolerans]|uniref:Uncharacterized protein n=1 Tax=Lysinibacillus boronitolerans JCM 21713 = 10a = NBRC 103108 TaxID=1294264 RepID=A0ABR4Y4L5_9BACI|nr:hypothetical protein [Lysinibacillus boronitolerans]KGR89070.1 hypothetical protein CD31_01490 [Lysinibacillus boronitolerans JCM 21713 = 10a = NBRC 103108]
MYNYNIILGYLTPGGVYLPLDNIDLAKPLKEGDEFILSGELLEHANSILSFTNEKEHPFRVVKINDLSGNHESEVVADVYIVSESDYKE